MAFDHYASLALSRFHRTAKAIPDFAQRSQIEDKTPDRELRIQ